jgi:hypothetical protein
MGRAPTEFCRMKPLRVTSRTRLLDRAGIYYPPPTKAQPGSLCDAKDFIIIYRFFRGKVYLGDEGY